MKGDTYDGMYSMVIEAPVAGMPTDEIWFPPNEELVEKASVDAAETRRATANVTSFIVTFSFGNGWVVGMNNKKKDDNDDERDD